MKNNCEHNNEIEYTIFSGYSDRGYFKCLDCGEIIFDWAEEWEKLRSIPQNEWTWEMWEDIYSRYVSCVTVKYTYVRFITCEEVKKDEDNDNI